MGLCSAKEPHQNNNFIRVWKKVFKKLEKR